MATFCRNRQLSDKGATPQTGRGLGQTVSVFHRSAKTVYGFVLAQLRTRNRFPLSLELL